MTDPSMYLMQVLWPGGLAVQAIRTAVELGLADLVADGPKSVEQLAAATGVHAPSLGKLMRALTSLGVFRLTEHGAFARTPVGDTLCTAHPQSMGPWAELLASDLMVRSTGALTTTIRTGAPGFEHAFGRKFFPYLADHPEDAARYDGAMGSLPSNVDAVVKAYDFSRCGRVVDVGGGRGALLGAILAAYPHVTGVLYDRPDVVANVSAGSRLSVVPGDFFAAVPPAGDTYILSRVLHDWDDGSAVKLLRNCRRGLNTQGRLLIVDAVAQDDDAPSRAFMDLLMMSLTGGYERSEEEFRRLLAAGGFRLTRVVPAGAAAVIESVPE